MKVVEGSVTVLLSCVGSICAHIPPRTVSTVDLHWLLYSTRSKRVNISQGFSSQQAIVTSICYWRAEYQCHWREEYQYVTGGAEYQYVTGGAEYQHVTLGRSVNVLLKDGISTCYWSIRIVQPTRYDFLNLFLSVRRSTCFRWVFRLSSGAQNCTYSVRPAASLDGMELVYTYKPVPSRPD